MIKYVDKDGKLKGMATGEGSPVILGDEGIEIIGIAVSNEIHALVATKAAEQEMSVEEYITKLVIDAAKPEKREAGKGE